MKEYLIVGGTNDGRRIEFEEGRDTLYIALPNKTVKIKVNSKKAIEIDNSLVAERYKKASIAYLNPLSNFYEEIDRIYAKDEMSDFEIIDELINNYKKA
jgi:hypothetical protein